MLSTACKREGGTRHTPPSATSCIPQVMWCPGRSQPCCWVWSCLCASGDAPSRQRPEVASPPWAAVNQLWRTIWSHLLHLQGFGGAARGRNGNNFPTAQGNCTTKALSWLCATLKCQSSLALLRPSSLHLTGKSHPQASCLPQPCLCRRLQASGLYALLQPELQGQLGLKEQPASLEAFLCRRKEGGGSFLVNSPSFVLPEGLKGVSALAGSWGWFPALGGWKGRERRI